MEVSARLSNVRISAQKARLVADQVRGLSVENAQNILKFSNKKAAGIISKVLGDLKGLDLASNALTSLPPRLHQLAELRTLDSHKYYKQYE